VGLFRSREVRFRERFGGWDLGVDSAALLVEFGAVGIFGDHVVVGAYGVEPEAVVG